MITRAMINWCNTKFKESLHEEDERKATKKIAAGAFVEGYMDAAVVMYIPVLIACYVWKHKALGK